MMIFVLDCLFVFLIFPSIIYSFHELDSINIALDYDYTLYNSSSDI